MKTAIVCNIDPDLLRKQRECFHALVADRSGHVSDEEQAHLDGLVNLLDAVQDAAEVAPPLIPACLEGQERRERLEMIRTLAESMGTDQAGIDIADRCTAELDEEDEGAREKEARANDAMRAREVRAHDCGRSGCGPVCTFGDP